MIVIVDYGIGNLFSIANMLKKAGFNALITSNVSDVKKADRLVLPGMGHFANCMLKFNNSGLRAEIERKVHEEKVPVLGICVGLQMMMNWSEEGDVAGLGWINGSTVRFRSDRIGSALKIPNMGWLEVSIKKQSDILKGLEESRFYFAHSYHVEPDFKGDILLEADYGYTFSAALQCENIFGVQFHPEKSHRFGLQLLKNFSEIQVSSL